MKNWFTSDNHFGHKRILEYNPETRPYSDMDDMKQQMISSWNKSVKHDDMIYILGDFSFYRPRETVEILKQLKGRKILVEGNHDSHNMKSKDFCSYFEEIHKYLERKIDDNHVVMFHFPIYDWHKIHYGSIHLHGHVHGSNTGITGKILDVGWDAHGRILSFEDVVNMTKERPIRIHGVGKG